ncbi:hypothetical protein [Streptomyces chartreusis]|uniref:hypothetical protein n=1 Tax=Streptomyces chartreusis TaxID=1969 RepID=UPI003656CBC7
MGARIRTSRRYLVLSYPGGHEAIEVNTASPARAHKVARSTARSGVLAVLHKHIADYGWKPVRRFDPAGGEA